VATNYFTKWVEAIPIKTVTTCNRIDFVNEHIVYPFGIPQTITTDQGNQFTSGGFEEYANSLGIKLLNSSPYYAQANGQAEAANKGIIKLIKHKIDECPKRWYIVHNEALWADRMACHGVTKVSPYQLVYGHDVLLHWELRAGSRRTSLQDQLSVDDYSAMMKEELDGNRLRALESIEKNKRRIARWYSKKVKVKEFAEGDLVWKLILPISSRDPKYGKLSKWEGPYQSVNAYQGMHMY
jgi:transposase InsO family protein